MKGRGKKKNFKGGRGAFKEVKDSYDNPGRNEPC